jgi:hypothetical protein
MGSEGLTAQSAGAAVNDVELDAQAGVGTLNFFRRRRAHHHHDLVGTIAPKDLDIL